MIGVSIRTTVKQVRPELKFDIRRKRYISSVVFNS